MVRASLRSPDRFRFAASTFGTSADGDVAAAGQAAGHVVGTYQSTGELPAPETATTLGSGCAKNGDDLLV